MRLLLLFLFVLLPGTAPACPSVIPAPRATALEPELMAWITSHTDYRRPAGPLPEVVFCRSGEVIDYEGRHIRVDRHLHAAYDLRERRIFLVRPWSPDDLRDRSALLHELTHYVQFAARRWPCPEAAEWEAYQLQAAWLAEQGVDAEFDWTQIRLMARCPPDTHR